MRIRNVHAVMILATILSLVANATTAATTEDTIKYRHAIMEGMSSHVAAIMMIATGKIDARQHLQEHADAVQSLSEQLNLLFPEGSGGSETEALPAIWEDGEKFNAAIVKMQETAQALQQAAGSDDNKAIMGAFAKAGKSCKGCHEKFRAEHEHDDSDSH